MSAVAAGHSEPQSEITDATAGCAAALEGHEVPTRFLWKHCTSKTRVELIGSWDSWAARLPMAWSFVHGAALLWLPLRPGTHEFKFIVDGDKWSYDIDFPTVLSGVGSRNNVVVVKPKLVSTVYSDSSSQDLRVMSYNVRYASAGDGDNAWPRRKDALADVIRAYAPDVLGLQEAEKTQVDFFRAAFPALTLVGVGRNDGREAGEFAAVMYNSARFDCVESGFFWLSETPLVPGSTAWGARVPRMATWLLLEDKCTPSLPPVLFINTHIDHESARARVEACKLLLQATKLCHPHADVILTGDFNCDVASEPGALVFATLRDSYRECHRWAAASTEGTFTNFEAVPAFAARIDWIGVSAAWNVLDADINRTLTAAGRTPSDHFAVTAVLRRGSNAALK